jgi:molybdopterin synthase catalytic subunit
MKTHIELAHGCIIVPAAPEPLRDIGAMIEFQGIVRELENGVPIPGLFYEAYEAMARLTLEKIFQQLSAIYPCQQIHFIHRLGFVPVGEASLYIRVLASHRQEALQLTAEVINQLKADVPIWKVPQKTADTLPM